MLKRVSFGKNKFMTTSIPPPPHIYLLSHTHNNTLTHTIYIYKIDFFFRGLYIAFVHIFYMFVYIYLPPTQPPGFFLTPHGFPLTVSVKQVKQQLDRSISSFRPIV